MLSSVFISYFKTYTGNTFVPISDGSKFSAIIGQNGVGKSSILEAIDCLFNNAEWNLNNTGKKRGEDAHSLIVGCFIIKKSKIPNKTKDGQLIYEIYKFIDSYLRKLEVSDFHVSRRGVVDKFIEYRNELLRLNKLDDSFLCLSGTRMDFSDAYFTVFDEPIKKALFDESIKKGDDEEKLKEQIIKYLNKYNDSVLGFYSYIYIPAEVDADEFTKLESAELQKLMGKDINNKISELLPQKLISEINNGLNDFVDGISKSLSEYVYRRLPGKDGYLTHEDVKVKIIEAFFATRSLNAATDSGDIPIKNLSSGEKRKALVDLALSFIEQDPNRHNQTIIALDEPEASLHIGACFEQYMKINEIAKKGCQTIVATHWYGFMPTVSEGQAIHIENNDDLNIYTVPLSNYKESINQRIKSRTELPSDIDLKSMNDLVQSIFHSIKKDEPYNWIICEGSTDKIYLEYYLSNHLNNLRIIPVGGAKKIKKIFEYLYIPMDEMSSDLKNRGKVFCLLDSDDELVKFKVDSLRDFLVAKRLKRTEKHVELIPVTRNSVGEVTVIEDSLEGYNFDKTLRSFKNEYADMDIFLQKLDIDDQSNCSARVYDLRDSQKDFLKSFFSSHINKMEFCKRYVEFKSVRKPKWVHQIETFFGYESTSDIAPKNLEEKNHSSESISNDMTGTNKREKLSLKG